MSFQALGLEHISIDNINAAGYENPTELQSELIPTMNARESAIVWTQSAAGKTGAFLIPALEYVMANPIEDYHGARVLILTSRRDRVNQITYSIKRLLGEDHGLRTGFIVSGRPYQPQMRLLRRPLDLMVATPGRLNDLVENKKADFSQLEWLIVDDLTTMHKKGLLGLIDAIVSQKPKDAPSIVFARPEEAVTAYTKERFAGAKEIEIEDERNQLLSLSQSVYLADDANHKLKLANQILNALGSKPALIFTKDTTSAKNLADHLANLGHPADSIAELDEEERNIDACPILIIPDTEDFPAPITGQEAILHYDLPDTVEAYRARTPEAHTLILKPELFLLVDQKQRGELRQLEDFLGEGLEKKTIQGLEPSKDKKVRGKGGKRRGNGVRKGNPRANGKGKQSKGPANNKRKSHYGRNGSNGSNGNSANAKKGGGQRKRNTNSRNDNNGGNYEIGGWEKDYSTTSSKPAKPVQVRYKEKKKRVILPPTS